MFVIFCDDVPKSAKDAADGALGQVPFELKGCVSIRNDLSDLGRAVPACDCALPGAERIHISVISDQLARDLISIDNSGSARYIREATDVLVADVEWGQERYAGLEFVEEAIATRALPNTHFLLVTDGSLADLFNKKKRYGTIPASRRSDEKAISDWLVESYHARMVPPPTLGRSLNHLLLRGVLDAICHDDRADLVYREWPSDAERSVATLPEALDAASTAIRDFGIAVDNSASILMKPNIDVTPLRNLGRDFGSFALELSACKDVVDILSPKDFVDTVRGVRDKYAPRLLTGRAWGPEPDLTKTAPGLTTNITFYESKRSGAATGHWKAFLPESLLRAVLKDIVTKSGGAYIFDEVTALEHGIADLPTGTAEVLCIVSWEHPEAWSDGPLRAAIRNQTLDFLAMFCRIHLLCTYRIGRDVDSRWIEIHPPGCQEPFRVYSTTEMVLRSPPVNEVRISRRQRPGSYSTLVLAVPTFVQPLN